ncbi:hypothetical protein [Chitinophaga sp. Cy-1792]|uniref:hypothetical protein n=1 Tax=Chitinophaga sp. Cy-1792 TaxID=2608339 RepID=UPI00141E57B4|nr:hypothetical protein [Chitinophaga sp. Cy-1792]NIG55009.1 hypothetical protein [Chitinophaga sp. Cy-1792]
MLVVAKYPIFFFLLFTIPLVGWWAYKRLSRKIITIVCLISLALLSPVIAGYYYVWNSAYVWITYVGAAFGWAFLNFVVKDKEDDRNMAASTLISVILFFLGVPVAIFGGMLAHVEQHVVWKGKGYRVTHIVEQGFAGGPKNTFELNRYAMIPIFLKRVEDEGERDSANKCWIRFGSVGLTYNSCEPDATF